MTWANVEDGKTHDRLETIIKQNNKIIELLCKLTEIEKEQVDCEHESDGMMCTSYPPKYSCKKCGEFYQ